MGRKTFQSIGKALPRRQNIVLSATLSATEGITVFSALQDAVAYAKKHSEKIFIIGGAAVYAEALPLADELAISHIKGLFDGDTFFPKIDWTQWKCIEERQFERFIFKRYIRQSKKD
jgi:dihydrofolate reductase